MLRFFALFIFMSAFEVRATAFNEDLRIYYSPKEVAEARKISHFKLIPQVGFVNTFFSGDDVGVLAVNKDSSSVYQVNAVTSYAAGMNFEYVQRRWGIESGILYRHLGYKVSNSSSVNNQVIISTNETYLNYVTIPLLAKLYFGSPLATAVFFKGGLLGSGLVQSERAVRGSKENDPKFQNILVEAVIGGGGQILITPGAVLTADLLYGRSLASSVESYDVIITTVTGLVGLRFDL